MHSIGRRAGARKLVWRAPALVVALALVHTGAPRADEPRRSLREILEQRNVVIEPLVGADQATRDAAARAYLGGIPWDDIVYLCAQGSPGVEPGSERLLQSLVKARLHALQPSVEELADLVADTRMNQECQQAIVLYVSSRKDEFKGTPEGAMLARAFLDLSDSGARDVGIAYSLEFGAAYLMADDGLMERMMSHCRSGDPGRVRQGLNMLGSCLDERAGDSLLALLHGMGRTLSDPKGLKMLMNNTARRTGRAAYPDLAAIHAAATDSLTRSDALEALALTGETEALRRILEAYDDAATGIADSTHALSNENGRLFYYGLWFDTRLAEPALIRLLSEGTPSEVELAIELLDRESRFGLPAGREEVYRPLERLLPSADQTRKVRIQGMLDRFRSYPDPRVGQGG